MANPLESLAKKPPAYKAAVFGGVAVLLGLAYWQLFYSSLSAERDQLVSKTQRLQKENKQLKEREQKWLQLVQKKEELDDMLKSNQISLPASSELPSFFVHLQKQAAASGVNLSQWARLRESPVETYVKVPVQINIEGSFYQINNYFRLLYETDRIITVEDLKLNVAPGKGSTSGLTLQASFKASTFRQRDAPPDTSLPLEVEQKDAKGKVEDAKNKREQDAAKAANAGSNNPAAPKTGGAQ